ncbi:MAG: hypothetical protein D6804_05455, partial [Aquificota bacterium]
YIPAPADVVKERKKKDNYEVKILRLSREGVPLITGTDKAFETVGNAFISYQHFVESYSRGMENIKVYPLEEFISVEYRIGIGLDKDRRVAKETLLYSQEFLRLERKERENNQLKFARAYISVLADGRWEDAGQETAGLGGERRLAFVKEESIRPFEKPIQIERGKTYKFYCTSHLSVEGGLRRGSALKINSLSFELLWLFGGGVEYVSGFAKPFLQMLRPGSVLLLKALDGGGLGCRLCQIDGKPKVNVRKGIRWDMDNFLDRGWNSGILMEVER